LQHTGTPNAKYWITNLLATTVGGKDLKTLTKATVSATTETEDASLMLHAMPYIMGGTKEKGVLLVNKKAKTLAVHLEGTNCSATIVEVSGEEPACNPRSTDPWMRMAYWRWGRSRWRSSRRRLERASERRAARWGV
jgi:hypothetical protein